MPRFTIEKGLNNGQLSIKRRKKFKSQRRNTNENQVSVGTSSSVESDSVSYSNSSSSDRPTTNSDFSNVDSLGYPIEQVNLKQIMAVA